MILRRVSALKQLLAGPLLPERWTERKQTKKQTTGPPSYWSFSLGCNHPAKRRVTMYFSRKNSWILASGIESDCFIA
jgi:hypothetical protein